MKGCSLISSVSCDCILKYLHPNWYISIREEMENLSSGSTFIRLVRRILALQRPKAISGFVIDMAFAYKILNSRQTNANTIQVGILIGTQQAQS